MCSTNYISRGEKTVQVKLITGMLSSEDGLFTEAEKILTQHFGEIDFASQAIPFSRTAYYENEMGAGLLRKFISFRELIAAENITGVKQVTRNVEKQFSDAGGARRINLDPGYVSGAKLVLTTTKNYDHRIYLRDGIYAEVTLHYRDGTFLPWEWTYPDYRTKEYIEIFNHIRKLYFEQLKSS